MTDVSFLLGALLVGGFLAGLGFWLAGLLLYRLWEWWDAR